MAKDTTECSDCQSGSQEDAEGSYPLRACQGQITLCTPSTVYIPTNFAFLDAAETQCLD